jgi:hypothetical protein
MHTDGSLFGKKHDKPNYFSFKIKQTNRKGFFTTNKTSTPICN